MKNVVAKSWSLHEWSDGTSRSWEEPSGGESPELPYTLPASGAAVAISVDGGNDALDVRPSAWGDADWDYSTFGSFGGGAFIPKYSSVGAYVVAGSGGHNHPDHHGAVVFDFSTGMWSRHDNANGVALKTTTPYSYTTAESNGAPWYEVTGSAVPLPSHLYATMAYDPTGEKGSVILVTRGSLGVSSAYSGCAHRIDLDSFEWARVGTGQAGRPSTETEEADAVWDEERDRWWFIVRGQHSYQSLAYLDRSDSTWKTSSASDWPSLDVSGIGRVMLHDGLLIRNCGSSKGLWLFDPDDAASGWVELTVSGTLPTVSNRWARYSNGNWYSIPSSGGNALTRIVPPADAKNGTWTIDTVNITGATLPSGQRGAYSGIEHYTRLFYVPALDCLAWIPGGSEAVYILKPGS